MVATYKSDMLFYFYIVNSWKKEMPEDSFRIDIITNLSVYKNLDIIKQFYDNNIKSTFQLNSWQTAIYLSQLQVLLSFQHHKFTFEGF